MHNSSPVPLSIYIFSFNRGQFLENCISSVKRNTENCRITVVDDDSYDPETLNVIQKHQRQIDVVSPSTSPSSIRLGGLYTNMNFAINHCKDAGTKYALFIQDDMQVVRSIAARDLAEVENFFDANEQAIQLQTCFLKKEFQHRDATMMTLLATGSAYVREDDYPEGGHAYFSAVGVFHVERLINRLETLRDTEDKNNELCKKLGIKIGWSATPFMMYLPNPISYRGRQRTLALRASEWLAGSGFYPYQPMSADITNRFLTRDYSEIPYAEDWLTASGFRRGVPWNYAGGLSSLVAQGGWRGTIGRSLQRIRRWTT